MFDVLGIGTPYVDFLIHLVKLPKTKDESAQMLSSSWQGGGKVATAMAAVGELSGTGAYVGVAGADSYGTFVKEDFERHGIDTAYLQRDGTNAFSLNISEDEFHGRNIIIRERQGRNLNINDIPFDTFGKYKYLHLEYANELTREAAIKFRAAGGKVCFDGDGYSKSIQDMLPLIDIFIGSEFYYKSLFGDSANYEENMRKFCAQHGCGIVGFTFGELGSAVLWEGGYYFAPGYEVNVVDTVGAGDTYHGTFLVALSRGMTPAEAAQFSNAAAAIKCSRIGGRAGIPSFEVALRFMQTGIIDYSRIDQRVKFYENFNLDNK